MSLQSIISIFNNFSGHQYVQNFHGILCVSRHDLTLLREFMHIHEVKGYGFLMACDGFAIHRPGSKYFYGLLVHFEEGNFDRLLEAMPVSQECLSANDAYDEFMGLTTMMFVWHYYSSDYVPIYTSSHRIQFRNARNEVERRQRAVAEYFDKLFPDDLAGIVREFVFSDNEIRNVAEFYIGRYMFDSFERIPLD